MDRVREGAAQSISISATYFPRRPMLLPKLLQALNDTESTRRTLVNLIVEDPALAGSGRSGRTMRCIELHASPSTVSIARFRHSASMDCAV